MSLSIAEIVQIVIGVLLTAGLPWIFVVERRLAKIEAGLSNGMKSDLHEIKETTASLSKFFHEHETRLIKLEIHTAAERVKLADHIEKTTQQSG